MSTTAVHCTPNCAYCSTRSQYRREGNTAVSCVGGANYTVVVRARILIGGTVSRDSERSATSTRVRTDEHGYSSAGNNKSHTQRTTCRGAWCGHARRAGGEAQASLQWPGGSPMAIYWTCRCPMSSKRASFPLLYPLRIGMNASKYGAREMVKIDEHKKLKSGSAGPYVRSNHGSYWGGEGNTPVTTTCPEVTDGKTSSEWS